VGFDRSSLQAMEKDNKESIREYAQRWHEKAAQVNPSLLEKEMINLFANTFKAPYFENLVGSSAQHFSDLVAIVEKIEQAIRLGRIADLTDEKSFTRKGKETEVHKIKDGYKWERKKLPKQRHLEITRPEDEAMVSLGQDWSMYDLN